MTHRCTLITWNLNFSGRTTGKYEGFSFKNRASLIQKNVKSFQNKKGCTIFAFQEVMPDYLDILAEVFPDSLYTIYTKKVHDVGRMLYTAVPKTLRSKSRNIAQLGNNFRDCWDLIDVFDSSLSEISYEASTQSSTQQPLITIVNLHAPMDAQFRLPICKHVAENSIFQWPSIIVGDLNTFSDGHGIEQIKSMEYAGFRDITGVILRGSVTSNEFEPVTPRVRVLETFDPYPYDNVPRDNPLFFPLNLDHVLIRKIANYECVLCYDMERDIVFEGKNYGNSDHFALSVTFEH